MQRLAKYSNTSNVTGFVCIAVMYNSQLAQKKVIYINELRVYVVKRLADL